VVHGRADAPVYLLVTSDGVQIRDAGSLWGRGAVECRETLKTEMGKSVSVVAIGQAGEKLVAGASLLADQDSSGAGGFGGVMGSKKLKAVAVVKGTVRPKAANPERLRDLVRYRRWLLGDRDLVGAYLSLYQPSDAERIRKQCCWGCPGCIRMSWRAENGDEGKFFCQSAFMYQTRARRYYGSEGDVAFRATKLCDDYGLDTRTVHVIMSWLSRCYRAGVLTEEGTGIPLSRVGSMEFAEVLLRKLALREGFGDVLAQGLAAAAESVGGAAPEQIGDLLHKAHQDEVYGARAYLVNALIWALDPRQPIQQLHEVSRLVEEWLYWSMGAEGSYTSEGVLRDVAVRFFGGEAAADFTSPEGKALAAKMIQDREYAKECLILCDLVWPVMTSPSTQDHVGDASLESRFFSVVTGLDVDETELCRLGERVFNLQRAILLREGHRDELPDFVFDTPLKTQYVNPMLMVPGPAGEPVSMKGRVLGRPEFEQMKGEYYRLRGWDPVSGRPTRSTLVELGLPWVADRLELDGLLG